MSWRDGAAVMIRAHRAGVVLTAGADGKLDWKAAQRPPDALLATLKQRKADILALLPQPPSASLAVARAKRRLLRLEALGFRPFLDQGALMITDATGRRRGVADYLPIGEVFDTIVAGLNEDPGLFDSTTEEKRR